MKIEIMKKDYSKLLVSFLLCFIYQIGIGQSDLKKSKYASLINDYLKTGKSAKMSNEDVKDLYIDREIFSAKTGVTNIYLNQRYNGIKIFNAVSTVGIKDDGIFHFANKFKRNLTKNINTTPTSLTASDAVYKAAQHFKLGNVSQLEIIEQSPNNYLFSKGNISQENISVEKVYFQDNNGTLRLAWDLNINTLDGRHWWSVRIDAVDGSVLDVNDWVLNCNFKGDHTQQGSVKKTSLNNKESFNLFKNMALAPDGAQYNVYALPTESPNHGSRILVSNPANVLASPNGWHDDDGINGAEHSITKGNNVHAYEDSADVNIGYSPNGTASLSFNFAINFNDYPEIYQDASITNLFYTSNMMHDIWYNYGFDEGSGNFQENNYSGQGLGGDSVNAEAQDGGGRNNANFATPPDGVNPRMQMYLWDRPDAVNFIINNSRLAGDYYGIPAAFGPPLENTPLTADLVVLQDDNAGSSTDSNDACDTVTNATDLNGKIAIVTGTGCQFGSKVLAAQNAGAIAVIVVSGSGSPVRMGGGDDGGSVTIPSIMIDQFDGEAIIRFLSRGNANASLVFPNSIDGTLDNGVVAHEYGHGISTRLTGGASNSNCLNTCTQRDSEGDCVDGTYTEQMGEGWSDWFALMVTMKPSDVATDGRGVATFSRGQDVDGSGNRPEKYSTDFAINRYTYINANNSSNLSAPHGVGFVWCTVLWDLTWAYIDKYGFDSDLYNGNKGNNKVMQLVLDGLKLQPCNPGFVDGRNALLAADMASTGGENQCLIWEVFANRGLGFGADQGDSLSRTDQVESFIVPNESQVTGAGHPSLASCTTLSSEDFKSTDYKVFPNPTKDNFTIRTTKNLGEVTLSLTDINGRIILSRKTTLFGDTEINMSTLQSGLYILNIKGEFISTNEKIIKN